MKQGFTLVELLAVLVLLSLIAVIAIPVVDKLIKENKEKLYQINVEMIEESARDWAAEHVLNLPEEIGDTKILTICDLEKAGKIEIDVKNPKTGENFYKDSFVTITKTEYGYEYDYDETSGTESAVCE